MSTHYSEPITVILERNDDRQGRESLFLIDDIDPPVRPWVPREPQPRSTKLHTTREPQPRSVEHTIEPMDGLVRPDGPMTASEWFEYEIDNYGRPDEFLFGDTLPPEIAGARRVKLVGRMWQSVSYDGEYDTGFDIESTEILEV